MKWYLYWVGLVSALFGVLYWKNNRAHNKPRRFVLGKSSIECVMLVLASIFMPAILVVYSSMYFTRWIKRPAFKIGAGFIVGTILMTTVGWALELLVLAGAFSINLISDDFLSFLEERKMKRGIATVLDGRATV
jgi:hypothetical protein